MVAQVSPAPTYADALAACVARWGEPSWRGDVGGTAYTEWADGVALTCHVEHPAQGGAQRGEGRGRHRFLFGATMSADSSTMVRPAAHQTAFAPRW